MSRCSSEGTAPLSWCARAPTLTLSISLSAVTAPVDVLRYGRWSDAGASTGGSVSRWMHSLCERRASTTLALSRRLLDTQADIGSPRTVATRPGGVVLSRRTREWYGVRRREPTGHAVLMARKRMIDPAMFTSESVAALPVTARWTWLGLLCYLDDTGRGKDNAALVKASVWPLNESYTARKVAGDIERLVTNGSLCRFECCGHSLLHAPRWVEWQKISHPTATKLCPCPGHEAKAHRMHRTELGISQEGFGSDSGAVLRNVVEVSSVERSSSGSAQPDGGPCPHGHASPRMCADCRRGNTAVTA